VKTGNNRSHAFEDKIRKSFNDHITNNGPAYFQACADVLKKTVDFIFEEEIKDKMDGQAKLFSSSIEYGFNSALQIKLDDVEEELMTPLQLGWRNS